MKLAYILLSVWTATAAASKEPALLSSSFNFEDGPHRVLKKDQDPNTKTFVSCDLKTEETCYDETYTKAVSCSLISDGGCPCPQGQERCGADLENGCVGWCTDMCCDWTNEYACYDLKVCAKVEDGCPCPEGRTECYPGAGVCSDVCCESSTEEQCYGSDNTPSFCAPIADGGCPCPDGQERCEANPGNNYVGYCAMECCDSKTEEFCYEYDDGYSNPHTNQYCKAIADGGCPCPGDQVRCGADLEMNIPGWCTDICCNSNTEEQCYNPPSCAPIVDGGCSCPAGQERCGANLALNYTGWCTDVCCDQNTEEFCYNYTGCLSNQYCAAIADGGCPCPEGTARCGADLALNYIGWCADVCCDQNTEETCSTYHDNGTTNNYCAAIADGGCPCWEGTERCGADPDYNILGWCTDICCNATMEETCYNYHDNGTANNYCAAIADGGCPCWEGTERCGADPDYNILGWCTDICCNATMEETCYDWGSGSYAPYCAAIADGGCPCWEGTERCGADLDSNILGWCTDACCDSTTQETCIHYWSGKSYCAEIANGGCDYGRRKLAQGDYGAAGPELVSYGAVDAPAPPAVAVFDDVVVSHLHHLEAKYYKLPDNDVKDTVRQKVALGQEIEKLHRIIKLKVIPAQLSLSKNHEQHIREKN